MPLQNRLEKVKYIHQHWDSVDAFGHSHGTSRHYWLLMMAAGAMRTEKHDQQ